MPNQSTSKELGFSLPYKPPYAWEKLLSFLAGRTIPGVEQVQDQEYLRTVILAEENTIYRGWIRVANFSEKQALFLQVAASLEPVLPQVLKRVRMLFDLDSDPEEIYAKLRIMNELRPGLCEPGTRLPGAFDPFEMSVRAVLGQQVTVGAARTFARRLAAGFGEKIDTPFESLQLTFPQPELICALEPPIEDHFGPLGITRNRARSIFALAESLRNDKISFSPDAEPKEELAKLLELPGFGPWTVQYVGMRAFAWPDAFPHTDYGVKKALAPRSAKEILKLSEAWQPWRGYATINLWNSLADKN